MEKDQMDVDNPNELFIVNATKNRLVKEGYEYCGTSANLYQFRYDEHKDCYEGQIFQASRIEDLSFEDMIKASNANIESKAEFITSEANDQNDVVAVLARNNKLKHPGIRRLCGLGFNFQISKVVSAYRGHSITLEDWLKTEKGNASTHIPAKVRKLLRTCYQAILALWQTGCTSDSLAKIGSYCMIDDMIQIDPSCIRYKNKEDKDIMLIRSDFAKMILQHIHSVWADGELLDFIALLRNRKACLPRDVLGAPVLLSATSREPMYHDFNMAELNQERQHWLEKNATPAACWKDDARNVDAALKSIIDLQEERAKIDSNFKGALNFASVVTSHYEQHFKKTEEGKLGVDMKGRVDSLLKRVLPQLLSKLYNSQYEGGP